MDITKGTPTRAISIKGVTLNVPTPFAEGHPLTEAEAKVLNQTFAENLSNNFRSNVVKALEDAGYNGEDKIVPAEVLAKVDGKALQKELNEYIKEYEFGTRRSGGGGGGALDPVERKARDMARALIRDQIRAKGYKLSDVAGSQITDLALKVLEGKQGDKIRALARKRLEEEQAIAGADIDISGLDAPAADAA